MLRTTRRRIGARKYRGKFDHGWDRQREITFEQQKKLGVIPATTKLAPIETRR